MHTLVIIPKPIWEWCVLSLSESRGLELTNGETEVELDGIGVVGCETWLSTFFIDLSVWTILDWLI